jgi:hypothetical protein
MTSNPLEAISQSQQDRLAHIDLRLRYLGDIRRNDLVSRFNIQVAAATRDLTLYKELAPGNIVYNGSGKFYERSGPFKPVFSFSAERVLTWLSQGYGDCEPARSNPIVPSDISVINQRPNLDTLSVITRAIRHKRIIAIDYQTLENGLIRREIAPFALANNGYGWSIRGFDRLSQQFMDFIVTRISNADFVAGEVSADETQQKDLLWNRYVELEIVPHPLNVRHVGAIESEYNMTEGVLKVWVRAPLAAHTLRRWNVDCSEKHDLKGIEYQLWLRNRQTLYGVSNLSLAPGYEKNTHSG